jgi:alkanesulfonate monooxygenase SsuD/methylene tetrahydromethanopterin reductase-like flavin-dependent oxidoreductase (luciferase family)
MGTLVTPLARRRPWVVARQTVSVDLVSNGRLVLGVGLGDPVQWDFGFFGEETDNKQRAEKVNEGLEIITGLWSGNEYTFQGKHYHIQPVTFKPTPVQSPRIPIWVGGTWPNRGAMRRAARWDGYHPLKWDSEGMQPADWQAARDIIVQYRTANSRADLIHGGRVPVHLWSNAAELIEPFREAGVTWWIEDVSPWRFGHSWEIEWQPEFTSQMNELIRRGPPVFRD